MARSRTTTPMCAVTIEYLDFVLPAADGIKLVQLMQNAVRAERDYTAQRETYQVQEQPRVEFRAIRSDQVRMPEGTVEEPAGAARVSQRKRLT